MSDTWSVPKPMAVLEIPMDDGALVYVRRHGNPEGPRIVLSHGNGLAADAYFPYWSLLTAKFDVFLVDLRSHGWNPVGDRHAQNIPALVEDCESVRRAIAQDFGNASVIGIFHSLSALIALLFEEKYQAFSALVLFDPPLCPPGRAMDYWPDLCEKMGITARGKQEWFEQRKDMADLLHQLPLYRKLLPGVPELFADTTLRPASNGPGFQLCCPREHEAQVYESSFTWAMGIDLGKIRCPLKVIGSDPTEKFSFLPSTDLSQLADVDYDFLPGTTHFLQLEKPEECAASTIEFLERQGLA